MFESVIVLILYMILNGEYIHCERNIYINIKSKTSWIVERKNIQNI